MEPRSARILVTGAASGIGRSAAILLAHRGARVLALDVADEAGAALAAEAAGGPGELVYRHADVTDEGQLRDAVADAVARWDGVDALVTVAGVMRGQLQDIRTFDEATWDLVVDTNLKGAFLAAKHAAGPMLAAGRGTIVLVGSKAGVSGGSGSYAYGASKGMPFRPGAFSNASAEAPGRTRSFPLTWIRQGRPTLRTTGTTISARASFSSMTFPVLTAV